MFLGLTDIHLSINKSVNQTLYLSTGQKITKLYQKLKIEQLLCVDLVRLLSNEQKNVGISHIIAWREKCNI